MEIKTKFNINDLILGKYQRNPLSENLDVFNVMEVLEIRAVSCMAGTQIYYDCRAICGTKDYNYKDGIKRINWVDFTQGHNPHNMYLSHREDEIVLAPQDVIDLVKGHK